MACKKGSPPPPPPPHLKIYNGVDDIVTRSSAYELVGSEFPSRTRLYPERVFEGPLGRFSTLYSVLYTIISVHAYLFSVNSKVHTRVLELIRRQTILRVDALPLSYNQN